MAQLRRDYQQFIERNTEAIAVGPENKRDFSAFWNKEKMPFTGIPDPKHILAKLYSQKVDPFKLGRMPALFVIDKKGKIRYKHYGDSMKDIPLNKDILSLLDALNKE
jgi:peroxiredoxin